jgi:hypothetical protein
MNSSSDCLVIHVMFARRMSDLGDLTAGDPITLCVRLYNRGKEHVSYVHWLKPGTAAW